MVLECLCEIGNITYRFSRTSSTFEGALAACKVEGGRLASFLKRSDYEELNSCCSQIDYYWIGLVDRGGCPENVPFRWDTSTICSSASPLNVTNQPNNSGCQGVAILTTGGQGSLPMAKIIECGQYEHFICQYLPPQTTTSATKTSISTNTARSASTTSFSSTQLSSVTSSLSVSFHTTPTTIASSTQSETNAAIISSSILGSIILLLMLSNFFFGDQRKMNWH